MCRLSGRALKGYSVLRTVIASEAKQSLLLPMRLLRACGPRNDNPKTLPISIFLIARRQSGISNLRRAARLLGREAAVDDQLASGDEGGFIRSQVKHRVGYILWLSDPSQRDS